METKLYIGTAGWSYKDWEGIVYAKSGGSHLTDLIQWFNTVEVNVTFYRMVSPDITARWAEQTRDTDFKFLVKVNQLLTHDLKPSKESIQSFKALLDPLVVNDKLGGILFQFPWRFKDNDESRDYLVDLFSLFKDYPKASEFRHASWNNSELLKILTDHQVAFTNIDQPVIGKSLSRTLYHTADLAYFRYHGRNRENWFSDQAGRDQRYDYLYDVQELGNFKNEIKRLWVEVDSVYVIFNNHFRGQAVVNALQMSNMLTGRTFSMPSTLLQHYPFLKSIAKSPAQLDLF